MYNPFQFHEFLNAMKSKTSNQDYLHQVKCVYIRNLEPNVYDQITENSGQENFYANKVHEKIPFKQTT